MCIRDSYNVTVETDIMNAYGIAVDLRQNIPRFGQEKIQFSMPEMAETVHHSMKQVMVATSELTGYKEEKPLLLDVGTRKEQKVII